MAQRLELILKLTERCNIACSYCYYFENDEKTAFHRPARLTEAAAEKLIERLDDAFSSQQYESIKIIFHGGEPLLYGKARFDALCGKLLERFAEKVSFCLQTNAMLIDEEWIAYFEKYKISVGVSIDGPAHIHNVHRFDKYGHPTHAAVVKGIQLLNDAFQCNRITRLGALVVIQNKTEPAEILEYLVNELDLSHLDFLIPDQTWDNAQPTAWLGTYLEKLFHAWLQSDQEKISIRVLDSTLSLLMGGPSYLGGFGPIQSNALTILADGSIQGDDFLRPCGEEFLDLGVSVFNASLAQAEMLNKLRLKILEVDRLPDACQGCRFEKVCCGGQLTHRFSRENIFKNKSIYCNELQHFYRAVETTLMQSGFTKDQLATV